MRLDHVMVGVCLCMIYGKVMGGAKESLVAFEV